METPKFKYYRRGTGELDTSNFPEIAEAGRVEVHHLDSRTLVSLTILNHYLCFNYEPLEYQLEDFTVVVTGYVCHMRADKDTLDLSIFYDALNFTFDVQKVQHDSRNGIVPGKINKGDVCCSVNTSDWFTRYVGADSSVHKFFPDVDVEAQKIREDGKVVSLDLNIGDISTLKQVVIVDDILGGGATVQMCVDKIRESGYKGDIVLWCEWNEGIHKPEFLSQFKGYYIGESIFSVN